LLLILILVLPVFNVHAAGVPTDAEAPVSSTITPTSSTPGTGYYYTVQPLDTLWDIALAHGISVETLVAANTQVDPKRLQAGQTVFVPAQPAVVPRKPTPAPPAPPAPTSPPLPEAAAAPAQGMGQAPAPAAAPDAEPAPVDAPQPEPAPVDIATDGPAPEPAPPVEEVAPEPSGWQAEILDLINGKRIAQGLAALTWSPQLARAAQAHADDCAQRDRGSHVGSDGARLEDRLARAGYAAGSISENWANAQSVQHAFGLWWDEPKGRDPHRRNILNPRFTEVGIGSARGPWGYYFVADFGGR
jgi:uncharacterized protein YkwD